MIPKGKLLIIGGHEDKGFSTDTPELVSKELKPTHFEILGRLISKEPHHHHTIEIIAAASGIPDEMEQIYINAYRNAGFENVGVIRIDPDDHTHDDENLKRINNAHAVIFTGGDQKRLMELMGGTPILELIKKRYRESDGFIVAGTSAGAMAIPATMIARGIIEEALLKSDVEISGSMGFIDGIIVDTHFIKRGRFSRLALAVVMQPTPLIGIGLGEDAAMLITNGNEAECMGSGTIVIVDASGIGKTNIADAGDNTPVAIENLKVHVLTEGCRYSIKERQFQMS